MIQLRNTASNKISFTDGYKKVNYPDGTMKLDLGNKTDDFEIIWKYENDAEMAEIYFYVRALKEQLGAKHIKLYMPYVPNARMDRIKSNTEVFTLKYFCEFINSLEFDEVKVLDVHSNVSTALLNRVVNVEPTKFIESAIYKAFSPNGDKKSYNFVNTNYVFFPDEGSQKRYAGLVADIGITYGGVGFGVKKRDWKTGKILGLDVLGEGVEGKNVLIIDDICSYGGTVYHSAKKLKELGCGDIYLYITHCENSILKGDLIKSGLLKKIYTTNSIYTGQHDLIEVFEVGNE